MMTCNECKFQADESEFDTTETAGERKCPACGSAECYEQPAPAQHHSEQE